MAPIAGEQLARLVRRTELAQDVAGFLIDRKARGLSHRTIQFYSDELRNLQAYLREKDIHDAHDVTPTHQRQYLLHLSATGNPGGIHAAYRAMRDFFRRWEAETEAESNPVNKVRPPKMVAKTLEPLPLDSLKAMLATCERRTLIGDRDRALMVCLLHTGCRAGEFVALDVGDVHPQVGAVLVRRGKGGKARTNFVGGKSRRELCRHLRHRNAKPGDALWTTVS